MNDIVYKIISMSYSASYLVAVIILLRVLFKKIPKKVICCLWALVAIRLVCPYVVESNFSLIPDTGIIDYMSKNSDGSIDSDIINEGAGSGNFSVKIDDSQDGSHMPGGDERIYAGVTDISGIADSEYEKKSDAFNADDTAGSTSDVQGSTADRVGNMTGSTADRLAYITKIWLAGIVVMVLYAVVSYILLYKKTRASYSVGENVYICDYVDMPFIFGMARPKIYVPSTIEDEQKEYVLAHERAHLKRHDNIWKLTGYFILSVYWFNPVIWLAYILFCRDIEFACDEKVVADKTLEYKKQYAFTLLSCSTHKKIVGACPLAFGEVGVKARIKGVLNYKKPTFWIVLCAVVICVIVIICFMTNPVSQNASDYRTGNEENNITQADSEQTDETQVVNEPVSENFEYEGWRITVEEQQGYKYYYLNNDVLIRNNETKAYVTLKAGHTYSDNPYLEMKNSDSFPDWYILNTSAQKESFTDGDFARVVYKCSESSGQRYVVVYCVPDKEMIWYLDTPVGMTLEEVEGLAAGISFEVVTKDSDVVKGYDPQRPLTVYEQYELAENKSNFLNNSVYDDDGKMIWHDGEWLEVFDLFTDEIKTINPEMYEALKNPVTAAAALYNLDYASYEIYDYSYLRKMIILSLTDGSKKEVVMWRKENSGLWKPFLELQDITGYEWNSRIIQANKYMKDVTAEQLKQVDEEYSNVNPLKYDTLADSFVILDSVPDSDIVLYGMYGGITMILRDGEELIPIWLSWMSPQMVLPEIYRWDYDNDGTYEYALWTHMNTGTGVSGDELYIIDNHEGDAAQNDLLNLYGTYSVREYKWSGDVMGAIGYYIDDTGNILTVTLNGEPEIMLDLTQHFEEHKDYNEEFDSLSFGSHYSFNEVDGIWYFGTSSGLYVKRDGKSMYTSDGEWKYRVVVTGRVTYSHDDGFGMEDIEVACVPVN